MKSGRGKCPHCGKRGPLPLEKRSPICCPKARQEIQEANWRAGAEAEIAKQLGILQQAIEVEDDIASDDLDQVTLDYALAEFKKHLLDLTSAVHELDDVAKITSEERPADSSLERFEQLRPEYTRLAASADRFSRVYRATSGIVDGPPEL